MSTRTSEPSQVVRYGLAGEFRKHWDTFENSMKYFGHRRNRIATLMFYLNDGGGTAGGHTVFPALGVSVAPQKGAALFWFNINSKGENLKEMIHAGCPVVNGNKWVLNRWLHEEGQDPDFTCPVDQLFPKKYYYLQ